jgi:hypothetical protein
MRELFLVYQEHGRLVGLVEGPIRPTHHASRSSGTLSGMELRRSDGGSIENR